MASNARPRPNAHRRTWPGWLAWLAVVAVLAASAWYASGPLARDQGWLVDGGSPTVDPAVITELHPQTEVLGAGVIDPPPTPHPSRVDPARVEQLMADNQPDLPGRYSAAIADLAGGPLAYDQDASAAVVPASTMKVMLAVAVLDALGPQHTFTTSVVMPSPATIVLVGGGDPLLASTPTSYPFADTVAPPSSEELAARTAAALTAQGITEVSLGYDDSLFAGPVWHPDWPEADRQFVAPISALVVDEAADQPGVESASPAAAATFAEQLRANGIKVVGQPSVASAAGGEQVAAIDSLPVSLLVQELLVHSNNFIAEMLLRQLALADDRPASFDGGTSALTARLTTLGLWTDGQLIADGSGLSMNNRLTTGELVAALQLAAGRDDLAAVLAGMPVAKATGTLANRFMDARSEPARGQVRAKTGTLDQVSGLAGYTPTADGTLLAFALLGNELPRDQDVRGWFDHVAAALAGCDCAA